MWPWDEKELWHVLMYGKDAKEVFSFVEKLLKERDKCWRRRINAIYDDCTTDWGTTDFELVAERILDLLKETE